MTTYGIVVFADAEELDYVGPWEVFTTSAMIHARATPPVADRVLLIAESVEPVRSAKGLRVLPDATFSDHPPLDVVLLPGGMGTRREVDNPVLIEWLKRIAPTATWNTSVCTGSLLWHGADVARDKRVATHWGFEDALEARGNVTVVRDSRWVQDGNLVTSQGVSAGIDMALWLIGQIDSPTHARLVQRAIQYDPAPPYQD